MQRNAISTHPELILETGQSELLIRIGSIPISRPSAKFPVCCFVFGCHGDCAALGTTTSVNCLLHLMKRTKSRQGLNSQSIEVPELSIQDLDGDIRRSNTMPPKLKNDGLTIRVLESGSKSLSLRRRNTTKVEYPTSAYFQGDSDNKPRVQTPGFTNVSLTAVNVLVTPDGNGSSHLSSPQTPAFENITANNKVITLVKPNLMRAFTRKALSYQKRQRFQNLCCVLFCPFSIVMVSLILKVLVSQLTADDVTTNFGIFLCLIIDVLYCSNKRSVNEQNWPIYNISSPVIARLNASEVPGATRDVRAVNYLSRLSLVDVSGRDPITQLASASLASSVSCSQWFGEQYPTGPQKIYEPDIKPIHPYSTKDSLYTSEIRSGWLDVLEPTNDGRDLENVYAKQALSLLRTFITYQTRPWAIVGASNDGDKQKIGSAPQEPSFKDANRIPGGVGIFPKGGSGILNTIESRYYAKGTAIPPKLNGYQKVPFFLTNFSSPEIMNDYLIEAIRTTIKSIGKLQPTSPELGKISADVAVADAFFRLQEAVNDMPYGAIFFEQIDHALKQYSYIMQFGGNKVLDEVIAFPNKGLRRLIQQSQLTNGILRNSATTLASTVITQGTRAFPKMEPSQFSIPFGSTIGRILYPLGISFLLPISALEVVRDKESKIVLMLRMNGLGNITAYYLSLYVQFFINYLLSSAVFLITGYIANLELYRNTDWLILIVLFLLWGHIQSTLAFMFASFFKSSTSATGTILLTQL